MSCVYGVTRSLEPGGWVSVLRLARELRVAHYDSAYLVTSVESGLALVADDGS